MSLAKYLQQFDVLVSVAERAGVSLVDQGWIDDTLPTTEITGAKGRVWKTITPDDRLLVEEEARSRHLATMFFMNALDAKYAAYKQECHNAYGKGRHEYPRTVAEAYAAMEDYRFNPRIYQLKTDVEKKHMSHHLFVTDAM